MSEETHEDRHGSDRPETWMPAGHFYSPVPDLHAVRKRAERIFESESTEIPGVDLRLDEQLRLAERFLEHYRDDYFPEEPAEERRYYWRNAYFPFGDAFYTDRFLRERRPDRIVEVGSGYSSAVMLDVCNELRSGGAACPRLDFVEPYPERLRGLLRAGDDGHCTIREQEVQDVPLELFESLAPGDLLFIDSSHVIKTGSDLWFLFFHVLPRLRPGVWVFLHDITWPMEYPQVWVEEGRAWNEIYLLRAFLQFNEAFAVRWFPGLALRVQLERIRAQAPLLIEPGGTGIWLERVK